MYGQTPGIAETGDIVYHHPTGETWVVAFVGYMYKRLSYDKYVAWCGWPAGCAKLTDCTLIKKGTSEERLELLHALSIIHEEDPRREWARKYIECNGFT